jgi:hypothetical protein
LGDFRDTSTTRSTRPSPPASSTIVGDRHDDRAFELDSSDLSQLLARLTLACRLRMHPHLAGFLATGRHPRPFDVGQVRDAAGFGGGAVHSLSDAQLVSVESDRRPGAPAVAPRPRFVRAARKCAWFVGWAENPPDATASQLRRSRPAQAG